MKISLKKSSRQYPPIYLNGTIIEEVTEYTNLGLTFNNKMTWESHITRIVERATKRTTTLHRIRHKLLRPALEKIYTSMSRPILEYADIIFDNSLYLNKVEKSKALI